MSDLFFSTASPLVLCEHFIKKFEAIPDEQWTTHKYKNAAGQRCAMGHCGRRNNEVSVEGAALLSLFWEHLRRSVTQVNDFTGVLGYPQPTPKARILAALHDIKTKLTQP